jgi:hypothetical protein
VRAQIGAETEIIPSTQLTIQSKTHVMAVTVVKLLVGIGFAS